jgi:hypothetical protein
MATLASQQKIIEFLNGEFAKIKAQNLQQRANKKLKLKAIEKKIWKLRKRLGNLTITHKFLCLYPN